MGFVAIIPMRIGTFFNNTSEVLKILENGYGLILETPWENIKFYRI